MWYPPGIQNEPYHTIIVRRVAAIFSLSVPPNPRLRVPAAFYWGGPLVAVARQLVGRWAPGKSSIWEKSITTAFWGAKTIYEIPPQSAHARTSYDLLFCGDQMLLAPKVVFCQIVGVCVCVSSKKAMGVVSSLW